MSTLNLPKPKLGDVFAFTISTPDLDKSFAYYQRLGFSQLFRSDFPFPLIMISDGAVQIMLKKDAASYFALTYYPKDIEALVKTLKADGIAFFDEPKAGDLIKRYLIKTPDGMTVSLVEYKDGFTQPAGPTMLTLPQEDYFKPEKYVNSAAGLYGELAQPVKDLDASIAFWQKLGFAVLSKNAGHYPWAILSDGLSILGLHQTTHFSKPTLTFFATGMKERVEKLEQAGLTDFTEAMGKGNVVLNTPEGQHINLFSF